MPSPPKVLSSNWSVASAADVTSPASGILSLDSVDWSNIGRRHATVRDKLKFPCFPFFFLHLAFRTAVLLTYLRTNSRTYLQNDLLVITVTMKAVITKR